MNLRWLRRRKKEQVVATNESLLNHFAPYVHLYISILKGSEDNDHGRVDEFLIQINEFCLHPLRDEIVLTSRWIENTLITEFPLINIMVETVYPSFLDSLDEEHRELFETKYYIGTGGVHKGYALLFLIRRLMLVEGHRDS